MTARQGWKPLRIRIYCMHIQYFLFITMPTTEQPRRYFRIPLYERNFPADFRQRTAHYDEPVEPMGELIPVRHPQGQPGEPCGSK